MKKKCIYSVILIFIANFALAEGRIEFEKTIHDFGKIQMNSKNEYIFRFKNSGSDTLIITRVRVGCSCTGTLLSKETLKPGERGSIKVVLHADRRLGEMTRSIYVYSNDPLHKRIRLVLLGNVIKK